MVSVNSVPVPNQQVIGRIVDNEAVLVSPGKGEVKVLNEVGSRIWSLIDGQRSVEDIAGCICLEFKVSLVDAENDTMAFIRQLADKNIISIGG
jgi:hypothetical protein